MKKKRLGALDICILAAIVLCIVGAAARLIFKEDSVLAQNTVLDTYTVHFSISNIRETSSQYLTDGTKFWIEDSGDYFGQIVGTPTTTPAEIMYVSTGGEAVKTYSNTDDDMMARIDVEGAMTISATMDENGFLMLNGNKYIAPGKEFWLQSRELYVTIKITSIVKGS